MQKKKLKPKTNEVGYIVSAWPRLSETFILNEVIAAERLGTSLRIFSLKDPGPSPVHKKVNQVRSPHVRLSGARHWKSALLPCLRVSMKYPGRFIRTLISLIHTGRLIGKRRIIQALCLADQLEREPVAHLHAHFTNAPAVVGMLVHQLTGVPYTFTAHAKDIYVKTPLEVLRAEIAAAQAVITCTEYNREFLFLLDHSYSGTSSKVHCIYHGLDLSEFKFRSQSDPVDDPPLILSVARLVEKKGLRKLIAAARLLRDRGRPFKIEIIGEGPLRPELANQVNEFGLQDRVSFLGAQPHENVRAAYARASIFALPCIVASDGDRDGIPNVLLEAMASGVPVVSTPVSGIPEVIESGQEGLLVNPLTPETLANDLERLLTDRALSERLARAARKKVETFFSLEHNCASLLHFFRNGDEVPESSRPHVAQIPIRSDQVANLGYRGQQ